MLPLRPLASPFPLAARRSLSPPLPSRLSMAMSTKLHAVFPLLLLRSRSQAHLRDMTLGPPVSRR
jgi:hypothetical protein